MASNRIKGITIEIGGDTTKLTDSLKKVDSSLAQTQSSLKDVNKLLKLDPTNTTLLQQKHELLSKAVGDTKEKLQMEKEALDQLKASGDTSDKAIQQQQALEREIISTTSQLESYEKQLKSSNVTLAAMGAAAEEVAEKTKKVSAAAAGMAGALLTNAVAAGAAADDLNTLSAQTGLSVEELQKMKYAQDIVDVSLDQMIGSIKKLVKQMSSGNSAFETLGVSIEDENGNMRNAVDVWYDSLEALSKVESETERDVLSMELFGKSAMDMAGIVDDGGASLKALGDEAEELGLIMSQEMVDDANEFNDAIDKMKARTSQAVTKMGSSLAKSLVPAMEKVLTKVTELVQWFSDLDGTTQTVILVILGLVAAISPVASMISKISTTISTLSSVFTALNPTVLIIIAVIGALIAVGVLLYKNWDTISEKAKALWEGLKNTFNGIKDTITGAFNTVKTNIKNAMDNAVNGVSNAANTIKNKFDDIKNGITNKINSAKESVQAAIDAIKNKFNFSWSLPALKMPHISITGGWSLKPPSAPKFSISWYKKAMDNGMILNSPTIFGMQGNKLLAGGEAGSETVVGTNSLMKMIQNAVGESQVINNITINAKDQNVYELADMVADRIAQQTKRNMGVFR